ncbi:MAG: hypothetical protein ACJAR3_002167 [Roseivirga sp.]|jgi:hypothetical protein
MPMMRRSRTVSGIPPRMDATLVVTTEILKDRPKLGRGPHYES